MRLVRKAIGLALALMASGAARGQTYTVTAQVQVIQDANRKLAANNAHAVIWLVPLNDPPTPIPARASADPLPTLLQKHKMFMPHLLVVQVGSMVQFPNQDPFFHNVFSLFNGKRFDLGLYEAGSTRKLRFDRAGVSYLFCNIHPEMSGVVVAVPTPYFAISGSDGKVKLSQVPAGRYQLHVWYERAMPEDLEGLSHVITVAENTNEVMPIRIVEKLGLELTHKNKYGQDYPPPTPSSPGYTPP